MKLYLTYFIFIKNIVNSIFIVFKDYVFHFLDIQNANIDIQFSIQIWYIQTCKAAK